MTNEEKTNAIIQACREQSGEKILVTPQDIVRFYLDNLAEVDSMLSGIAAQQKTELIQRLRAQKLEIETKLSELEQ